MHAKSVAHESLCVFALCERMFIESVGIIERSPVSGSFINKSGVSVPLCCAGTTWSLAGNGMRRIGKDLCEDCNCGRMRQSQCCHSIIVVWIMAPCSRAIDRARGPRTRAS